MKRRAKKAGKIFLLIWVDEGICQQYPASYSYGSPPGKKGTQTIFPIFITTCKLSYTPARKI
jgi:hypothetical protein